jgi:hypothetical protein
MFGNYHSQFLHARHNKIVKIKKRGKQQLFSRAEPHNWHIIRSFKQLGSPDGAYKLLNHHNTVIPLIQMLIAKCAKSENYV